MTTPIVRGSHPEAIVRVRSTANGAVLEVRVSTAAAMTVKAEAELVDELDPDTEAAFDAAVVHQLGIHAVARTLE